MYDFLKNLDRRWIFLLMGLAVAIPILAQAQFPEKPSGLAVAVFDEVEKLNEGDRILFAFDFDPGSEGELGPMATAFVRHACEKKKLKMYFMALWPVGEQMIVDNINKVIKGDPRFEHLEYGEDYVNIGFKAGNEGVIKVVLTDLKLLYTTDADGKAINDIPMMEGMDNIRRMDLVANISAGYPGTKEWVQYAATRYPEDITLVAGCTGVQAPLLYPYIPEQLPGLLAAIKGASEYEALVMDKYGRRDADGKLDESGIYLEGQRRMGPQLIAHLLMIMLIIAGNAIYFAECRREGR